MSNFTKLMQQAAAGNAGGDFYPYTVDYSARFNDNDSAVLYRDPSSNGDADKVVISLWVKRANINLLQYLASSLPSSAGNNNDNTYLYFATDNTLSFISETGGSTVGRLTTSQVFRDTSAWYHIVAVWDSGNATSSDRIILYVNGTRVTSFSSTTYPSQNADSNWHKTGRRAQIGARNGSGPFDGYIAQAIVIDGTIYTASNFGETKNGVWIPKDVSGLTFGTNGFYLDFADSSALGNDVSGNNNDFTSSGLTSSDQMTDTPTHNNVTWLPTYDVSGTMSDGNLTASVNTSSQMAIASSVLPSTGKWYWEIEVDVVAAMGIGMANTRYLNAIGSNLTLHYNNGPSGNSVFIEGSIVTTYGTSWTTGDVIGVYFNADDGEISWYKNGTAMDSSPYSLSYSDGWIPYMLQLSGAGTCVGTLVTDENKFNHTPPTDALSLSTANLPEPVIGPNSATTSDENFNTVLYTGNGSTQSVTGVNFQPDWVWLKARSTAQNNYSIDAVRGINSIIVQNNTNAESYYDATWRGLYGNLTSFDADGFTVVDGTDPTYDSFNGSGDTYVAWNWKANGSGVSNTDGSITSTVSANTDAGISIVKYVGTANGSSTVGHGLGVAPAFIIVCPYTQGGWVNYHASLGVNQYIEINNANAAGTSAGYWGTAVNSSVFGLSAGGTNNRSGASHIAYLFAEVESFSSFGKYTGNGSTDGPFIYTGFRPAFIITKRTDTSGYWWEMVDTARAPYNPSDQTLYANVPDAEYTSSVYDKDLLSNGFKIRGTNGGHNASGGQYIYMAFSEAPFKYSNAR